MDKLTIRAMGKINLGLDVIRRMENGYHQVKMVMQTVKVYDELTFERREKPGIVLTADVPGLPVDESNLIHRAARRLEEARSFPCGAAIHLQKRIPMAAGMAGGSADAAAAFVGLNRLLDLGFSRKELQEMAVKVGADVPYCIEGGTRLSEGIGEVLTPLPAPPACSVLIAKPDIDVSTRYVYENLHVDTISHHPDVDGVLEALRVGSLARLCGSMENILERVTGKEYPVIGELEARMKEAGALASLMSGSGPTVFGLFAERAQAETAAGELEKKGLASHIFVTEFADEACVVMG